MLFSNITKSYLRSKKKFRVLSAKKLKTIDKIYCSGRSHQLIKVVLCSNNYSSDQSTLSKNEKFFETIPLCQRELLISGNSLILPLFFPIISKEESSIYCG